MGERNVGERMEPRLGALMLLLVSVVFGANHVAARIAMEHGTSVAAAAAVRSAFTAVVVLALLVSAGVSLSMPRRVLARMPLIGGLIALQSFCLFSAVGRIPVALALLVFQLFPLIYLMLSWAAGKERPPRRTLVAAPLALAGLALVLDVAGISGFAAAGWDELGAGCLYALVASAAFAAAMFLNAHWVGEIDGRVRVFFVMAASAALLAFGGAAGGALFLPADGTGWTALAVVSILYGAAITSTFLIVPRLRRASATVALNFEPVAAMALAWMVLGQTIRPLQILGGLIVTGAIGWLALAKR